MSVDKVDFMPNHRSTLMHNNNDYKVKSTMVICEVYIAISTSSLRLSKRPQRMMQYKWESGLIDTTTPYMVSLVEIEWIYVYPTRIPLRELDYNWECSNTY
jgi:hypothetical protein